jgi:hypothetical protein
VDAALSLYGTIERAERAWAEKVSSGEWQWGDGHERDIAELYRTWYETAADVVDHLDDLRHRNITVRHADALREAFGKVAALIDIGLDRVFQQPTPPRSGKRLREVRDGLRH